MYSPERYTALISTLAASSLICAALLYKAFTDDSESTSRPITQHRTQAVDLPPKPVADSAVHVSYRVTSDMAGKNVPGVY